MFSAPSPVTVVPDPVSPPPPTGRFEVSPAYRGYRRAVERLIADGVPFEPLARAIDETDVLAADQRAALWLLAWSLIGPDADRPRARLT